jgi:hypothetical protein
MPTECTLEQFEFEAVERRAVVACFDGGDITSNAGALLLGQVDRGPEQGRIRNGLSVSAADLQLLLSRTSWRKPSTVLPLRATTRAHQDSHCGKPHATGLAIREPQTTALRPDPIALCSPKKPPLQASYGAIN